MELRFFFTKKYQSYTGNTILMKNNSKGHNSVKNIGGVSVLVFYTSSDDDLHLYQISLKYLERYPSFGVDTKSLWTKRQTDGQRARHNTTRHRRAYKNKNWGGLATSQGLLVYQRQSCRAE